MKKLRHKQKETYVIDSIADLMVDFFSNQKEKLIDAYGKTPGPFNNHLPATHAHNKINFLSLKPYRRRLLFQP